MVCPLNSNQIVILGGYKHGTGCLQDVFIFDRRDKKVRKLKDSPFPIHCNVNPCGMIKPGMAVGVTNDMVPCVISVVTRTSEDEEDQTDDHQTDELSI